MTDVAHWRSIAPDAVVVCQNNWLELDFVMDGRAFWNDDITSDQGAPWGSVVDWCADNGIPTARILSADVLEDATWFLVIFKSPAQELHFKMMWS